MRLILAFAFVFLSLGSSSLWAQGRGDAQDDVGYLTELLQNALSNAGREVKITGFRGALSSEASIETMTFSDAEGVWMRFENVTLNWRRVALAERRLVVNSLTAAQIEVLRTPAPADSTDGVTTEDTSEAQPTTPVPAIEAFSPESSAFRLPRFPVSVDIGAFAIEEVILREAVAGEAAILNVTGSANLVEGIAEAQLIIDRLDSTQGRFELRFDYNEAEEALFLALNLNEPAGGLAARSLGIPGEPALSLTAEGDGTLDDWRFTMSLDADQQERASGEVRLIEDTGGRLFEANFTGDLAPLVAPDYAALLGNDVSFQANGQWQNDDRIVLQRFVLDAEQASLQGGLILNPSRVPERLAITGLLGSAESPLTLPFADDARINFAQLAVRFDATRSDEWRGALSINGYDGNGVAFETAVFSGSGQANVTPGVESFSGQFDLRTEALSLNDPDVSMIVGDTLQADGQLSWQHDKPLIFRDFNMAIDAGALELTGAARWAGRRVYTSALFTLASPDLSLLSAAADRDIEGAGTIRGLAFYQPLNGAVDLRLNGNAEALQLDIEQLDSLLAAGPAQFALSARRNEAGLALRALQIENSDFQLNAAGRIVDDRSQAELDISFANSGVFSGEDGGPLAASAVVSSTDRQRWDISLNGNGRDIRIGRRLPDRHLQGASQFSASGQWHTEDGLQLSRAVFDGEFLNIDASGRIQNDNTAIRLDLGLPNSAQWGEREAGPLQLSGVLEDRNGVLRMDMVGTGQDIGIGRPNIDQLTAGPARISLAGQVVDGNLSLSPVEIITPGTTLRVTGEFIRGDNDLNVELQLADLGIVAEEFPGPASAIGTVRTQNRVTSLDLAMRAPGGVEAQLAGSVRNNPFDGDLTLIGEAPLALANEAIVPRLADGLTRFDLRLNGPAELGAVSGVIDIVDASISDPTLNARIDALEGRIRLSQGRAFPDLTASWPQGGEIAINGALGIEAPFEAALQIDIDDLNVQRPGLFETTAEGGLNLRGPLQGNGGLITGSLRFDGIEARIPEGGGQTGGTSIPDIVHLGDSPSARNTRARAGLELDVSPTQSASLRNRDQTTPRGIALDMSLIAPDRVFVRGRGIDAEFGGRLELGGTTRDLSPSGAFSLVRGRVNLLGQRLDLTEGQVRLLGDLTPEIRLVAETVFEDGIAQLIIEGTIDEPDIRFASSPELPEDEIIAQIFFGEAIEDLSPFQLAQIAGSISALAGGGTDGPLSQIRERLRLDDLDITSDEEGRPGLAAGTYLSDETYADVEIQGDGTTQITINVDVGSGFTVRGRSASDGDNGLGLFFERDY